MAAGRVLPKLVLVENTNAAAFKTPGSQATKYTFRHTFRLLQTAPRGERLLQTAPRRDRGRLETVCNETSKDTPTCSKTCFSYVSDQTKTKGCPISNTHSSAQYQRHQLSQACPFLHVPGWWISVVCRSRSQWCKPPTIRPHIRQTNEQVQALVLL